MSLTQTNLLSEKKSVFMLAQLSACKHKDTALNTEAEPLIQKAFKPERKAGVQTGKVTIFACPTVILFPRHPLWATVKKDDWLRQTFGLPLRTAFLCSFPSQQNKALLVINCSELRGMSLCVTVISENTLDLTDSKFSSVPPLTPCEPEKKASEQQPPMDNFSNCSYLQIRNNINKAGKVTGRNYECGSYDSCRLFKRKCI